MRDTLWFCTTEGVAVYVVPPVGVGIYGGIAAGVVAPFVDFALGETRCLSVGYQTGILNLHEIGIVGHEVEAFGYCLK